MYWGVLHCVITNTVEFSEIRVQKSQKKGGKTNLLVWDWRVGPEKIKLKKEYMTIQRETF